MHSFPLSKDQYNLIRKTKNTKYNLIEYHDHDKANHTILAMVYDQLTRQETCLIIASDLKEATKIEQHLRNLGLDKFFLTQAYHNQITEYHTSQWRASAQLDITDLEIKMESIRAKYLRAKEQNSKSNNQLRNYYYELHHSILGDLSTEDLSHAIAIKRIPEHLVFDLQTLSPTLFRKNETEWKELLSVINKGVQLYTTDHIYIEPLLAFKEEFLAEKSIDDIIIELKEMLATLTEVRHYYKNALMKYTQQLTEYFTNHIKGAKSAIDNLLVELLLIEQQESKVDFIVGRELKILNEHLSKIKIEEIPSSIDSLPKLNTLKDLIIEKKDDLENSNTLVHKRIGQYCERIRSEDIALTDQDHIRLWNQKLNKYRKSILDNGTSINPSDTVKHKLEKIERFKMLLETQLHLTNVYPKFIQWRQFIARQAPAYQLVLHKLQDKPVALWNDLIETWYYQMCINNRSKRVISSFAPIQKEMNASRDLSALQLEYLELQLSIRKIKAIETLKHANQEVYKSIFRKKLEIDLSLDELLLSTEHLLASLYPIMIVSPRQLSQLSYAKKPIFDTVIFQDPEQIDHLDLSTFQLASKLYIFSPAVKRLSQNLQLKPYLKQGKVISLQQAQIPPINQKNGLTKVSIAKKLAKVLLSIQEEISIFHSKNNSIISCCTGTFATLTRQIVTECGVKELYSTKSKEDRLVEALLSIDKEQYIIIQDGLINPRESDYIKHQIELIAAFSTLGFSFIDLWTDDALQSHHRKNINKLKAIKTPILANQNQREVNVKDPNT